MRIPQTRSKDHIMHDDFVYTPPKNVGEGEAMSRPSLKWPVKDKTSVVSSPEELGRIKQSDVQGEWVEEDSVHS